MKPLPRIAGRYRLKRLLSKREFSQLWSVQDERSSLFLRLRLLSIQTREWQVEQFLRSALSSARLKNAQVLQVLDCGRDPQGAYIVTESLPGLPLSAWLKGHPPWRFLYPVLIHLCDALAEIHAQDLINLGFCPENILVNSETLKVNLDGIGCIRIDDGWSKRPKEAHLTLKSLESMRYLAPEMGEAAPWMLGPWSDLYSLGLIIWELLTGNLPFPELKGIALLCRRSRSRPQPLPLGVGGRFHRPLSELLMRLLEPQPQDRPQTAAQIRASLETLEVSPLFVPPFQLPPQAALTNRAKLVEAGLPLLSLDPGPVVDREPLFARLWKEVQAVGSGGGSRILFLQGAMGVGKSRLVEELALHVCRMDLMRVWKVHFDPESPPGSGLSGALEELLRARSTDQAGLNERVKQLSLLAGIDPEGLEQLLPALLRPDPSPFARPSAEPDPGFRVGEEGGEHMIAGVFHELVHRISAQGALLLWLDDLQFAEIVVLERLEAILLDLQSPLLILATVSAESQARYPLHQRFPPEEGVLWLQLGRISRGAAEDYCRFRLNLKASQEQQLLEAAEGLPVKLRGLCNTILRVGMLSAEEGRSWRPDFLLPESEEERFMGQLKALPHEGSNALVPDIVMGLALSQLPLSPRLIEALATVAPQHPFYPALNAAEILGLLERKPMGVWRFPQQRLKHWLKQQGESRAPNWHRRWIKALRYLEGTGRGRLGLERAWHAQALDQDELAVEAFHETIARALGPGQAAYRRALLAAERLILLGESKRSPLQAARGARLRGELLRQRGESKEALAAIETARERLNGLQAPVELSWCALSAGWLALDEGASERAEQEFHQVASLAQSAGYEEGLLWSKLGLGELASRRQQHRLARTLAREALQGFDALGATRGSLAARMLRARAAERARDFGTAERRYRSLQGLADQRGWILEATLLRLKRIRVALEMNRAHDAQQLLEEAELRISITRTQRLSDYLSAVRPGLLAAVGDGFQARKALVRARLPNPPLRNSAAQLLRLSLRQATVQLDENLQAMLQGWLVRVES